MYESFSLNELREPVLRIWRIAFGTYLRLAYCDGTQFWLDRAGATVWALWPDTSSLEITASYLLGPVLGLLLRLRGITCLHASAVTLKDRSIALVGSEGAGKSTTAAAFVRLGHPAISDDVVALEEQGGDFRVAPAVPHLALWPDSVSLLYGSSDAFPRISPDWEKRRLALGSQGTRFEERRLPLGAIYILGDRRADPAPFVETIPDRAALMALVVNSYATNILDPEMRAQEFKVLGRLVSSVPVRHVSPHQDPARIEELCQVIREDFETLEPKSRGV
ncbi:MAG TPA: serine/threonine protein kinase [Candidatus Dormibacteraeota bacterium]|nr:serine/threonine protein kinase [Candidatus Dormibacteraeota bacterium]